MLWFEDLPRAPATATCRIAGGAHQGRSARGRPRGPRHGFRIRNPDIELQNKVGGIDDSCMTRKADSMLRAAAVAKMALRTVEIATWQASPQRMGSWTI